MKSLPKTMSKITGIILLATTLNTMVTNCSAQSKGNEHREVPQSYLPSDDKLAAYRNTAATVEKSCYDLTSSLPANYVKDGSVDYTAYLQAGLNSNAKVVFPDFPVLVTTKGLTIKSNSTIIFRNNSKIKLQPTTTGSYEILKIVDAQNVMIYFPVIEGDRKEHKGTAGEWGMGISITGSSNVQLFNPKVSDCWGDGIYFGKKGDGVNSNINILYAQLDNNRRNGISVICADGLYIESAVVSNTNGTPPMAGIDIEPNDNNDEINNINISKAITFNGEYGIIVELDRLYGSKTKNINIKIDRHVDDGSSNGLCFLLAKQTSNTAFQGNITVVDPTWKNNSKEGFVFGKSFKSGLNIHFSNVRVMKKDGNGRDVSDDNKLSTSKKAISRDLNAAIN